MKARAMVEVSSSYKPRTRLWGYGYPELAQLLGVKEQTVRLLVSRGEIDPGSLQGVLEAGLLRNPALRAAMLTAFVGKVPLPLV